MSKSCCVTRCTTNMLKNPELRYKLSTPQKMIKYTLDFCKMLQQDVKKCIVFLSVCENYSFGHTR